MAAKRKKAPPSNEIKFPLLECWNPIGNVAMIAAEVNKERVLCRISAELLEERFEFYPDDPMRAVTENRTELREAAKRRIESRAFEEDGNITVALADFD